MQSLFWGGDLNWERKLVLSWWYKLRVLAVIFPFYSSYMNVPTMTEAALLDVIFVINRTVLNVIGDIWQNMSAGKCRLD